MEKTLSSIYLDPSHPASFGGVDAVYRELKEQGKNKISRKQVKEWLRRPVSKNQTTSKFRGKSRNFDSVHILMLDRLRYN